MPYTIYFSLSFIHNISTPIEFVKGVGPQRATILNKELGIFTVGDLLNYFPYRYLDSNYVQQIKDLSQHDEYVLLKGIITQVYEEGEKFKKRVKAVLIDASGEVELVWFQGIQWIQKYIEVNKAYSIFGKVSFFNGKATIVHPDLEQQNATSQNEIAMYQPLYSTTEKLRAKGISNRTFAKLVQAAFEKISQEDIPEILPVTILHQYRLMPRYEAYVNIHFPKSAALMQAAIRRQKWEELFITQLKIGKLKLHHQKQLGFYFEKVGHYFNTYFAHHLPFELTNAQKKVIKQIRQDTQTGLQMNRLIQGDVGSGKTMVALMSMLLALDNGFQACLMAPTEILAQQHYQSISETLSALNISVALLTGSVKGKERTRILKSLQNGEIQLVIGTHALVEDKVQFKNLGLAVIDEQHRFGVSQRAKLWGKNTLPPHIMVMTATPIPRTLAMTVYGDLDVSVIDELPPGRKPIQTMHRTENFRPKVMQFIKHEIDQGRQVYIVYPLIDESDKLAYESLTANYEQVKAWFPDHKYKIAMVHGRQPQEERERNMERFVQGKANILVATTVIEVGVNVPNASIMLIESAERFGLSQLHQLRGRVGRGTDKSYCILLTGYELSQDSRARMSIMSSTTDGFVIAEEDLKMRGPGDLYGTKQSGALNFKIADIIHDVDIMEETKTAAIALLQQDAELLHHKALAEILLQNANNTVQWNKIS